MPNGLSIVCKVFCSKSIYPRSWRITLTNPPDAKEAQPYLAELKGRDDWFKSPPTVDAVFWHLKNMRYFKEFRAGDVRMEKWDYPETLGDMIGRSVRFLYF